MDTLIAALKNVPFWVWIIAAICIIAPTGAYLLKRSIKVIGIVCIIAALIFVFPSIGKSFMEQTGLRYDEENGTLTNSDGQTIKVPSLKGSDKNSNETSESSEGTEEQESNLDVLSKYAEILNNLSIADIKGLKDLSIDQVKEKFHDITGKDFSTDDVKSILSLLEKTVTNKEGTD